MGRAVEARGAETPDRGGYDALLEALDCDEYAPIMVYGREQWEGLMQNGVPPPPSTPSGRECIEFSVPLSTVPEYCMYHRYELTWGVRRTGSQSTVTSGQPQPGHMVGYVEFEDPFMFIPDRSYFYRYELRSGLRLTQEILV